MAYIAPASVSVGDPVKRGSWTIVTDDIIDLNARTAALEAVTGRVVVLNDVITNASVFSTATSLHFFESPLAFTLTEFHVTIFLKGSLTGTLELDLKKNTSLNPAGFATVMTTKPSITYASAANYDQTANAVFDNAEKDILVGDFLKIDITQAPGNGVISAMHVLIYGEI